MRENAYRKGRRYLLEARLTVTHVEDDDITATCRGDGVVHLCGYQDARGWWCSCECRTDQCSHLTALRLVTIRRKNQP